MRTGHVREAVPSAVSGTMESMFVARLICSDSDCAEEAQAYAATLGELELLLCDCGCTFELIGWPDEAEAIPEVITLHRARRRGPALNAAA